MMFTWLLLQTLLLLGAVQLMDRNIGRRALSALLVLAALLLPFFVGGTPLLRALLASLALLALVKVLQVAQAPELWSASRRVWHALVPFDIAGATRAPGTSVGPLLPAFALHAVLALAALSALWLLPNALSPALQGVRLVLGTLLVYTGMEAITGSVRVLHLAGGIAVPPMQDLPIASTSIREFWSRRWNRPVSGWLNEFVFTPVSRRQGVALGLIAAFAASGLLHAWVFLAAAGFLSAAMAVAFFMFHSLFVMVESFIGMRRFSVAMRRAWTLGLLLLSSPLFVEPVLRVLQL